MNLTTTNNFKIALSDKTNNSEKADYEIKNNDSLCFSADRFEFISAGYLLYQYGKVSALKRADNYSYLGYDKWYTSDCLYGQGMCTYPHHGGARISINSSPGMVQEKILTSNNSGYKRPSFDTLIYNIDLKKESFLVRKMFFEEKFSIDSTFAIDKITLTLIDTIKFTKKSLIRNVFGKAYGSGLKIYVFNSQDSQGTDNFHFWVDGIGIIKVIYKNCWRYSFELSFKDHMSNREEKLFRGILKTIRKRYQNPLWLDAPCNITYQ